ncbi:DUF418 domain-containing protein [Bailinhaonella thermotolerans]|uniref:DUF418 domain-containing protein n=1 Tax=Bailinhaonella thermotolerans TaxID=1070861 RepID=A0A3A4BAH7_9ACTN|nr:DUF418 domain-containing protein [Bailinhaonella thermotolerans]
MVNLQIMATSEWGEGAGGSPGSVDDAARAVVDVLFTGKFYVLFSFLFGYSFALQMEAAARDGASVVARTLRRCAALFAVGLAHALLIWDGDILTAYAVVGLILLVARRMRPRTAAITGGVLFALPVAWLAGGSALLACLGAGGAEGGEVPDRPAEDQIITPEFVAPRDGEPSEIGEAAGPPWSPETAEPFDAFRGHFSDVFLANADPAWLPTGILSNVIMVLMVAFLGLAAGRARLLEDTPDRWLGRAQVIGFTAGAAAAVVIVAGGQSDLSVLVVNVLAGPALAAAHCATLLRVVRRRPRAGLVFAPAGRLAASNYVAQSVVGALVFTGYGLALYDQLRPVVVLALAVIVYAAQLAVSAWWTRRHRHGPVEWVLRSATYGRPWRREPRPGVLPG